MPPPPGAIAFSMCAFLQATFLLMRLRQVPSLRQHMRARRAPSAERAGQSKGNACDLQQHNAPSEI